ncbi:MAG: pyrimidine reductase family protein [Specibacter sp.]
MMERIFPDPAVLSGAALEHEVLAAPPENRRSTRPWVSFNFIASIDGAATMDGLSGKLGNAWDLRVFSLMRQTADVVLVGAQTVRAEGYGGELLSKDAQKWRAENWLSEHPPVAIVSGSLNLDPGLEVFTQAPVRPLVLTLASAPQERREALSEVSDVVNVGEDSLDVARLITELSGRGYKNIHSEGGPTLLGSFAAAGRVDELNLTVSPLLAGGSAGRIAHSPGSHVAGSQATGSQAAVASGMTLTRILKAESMLFLRYVRPAE